MSPGAFSILISRISLQSLGPPAGPRRTSIRLRQDYLQHAI